MNAVTYPPEAINRLLTAVEAKEKCACGHTKARHHKEAGCLHYDGKQDEYCQCAKFKAVKEGVAK